MLQSTVHFAHNLDVMRSLSDGFADIAVDDPPYGIGESSANHSSRNTPIKQKNGAVLKAPATKYKKAIWDSQPPTNEYFKELFRICRNYIIWGGNYFEYLVGAPFKPPRRDQWPQFIADNPRGWIIWDKVNGDSDFNDCELAFTSFDRPTYILPYMWNGMMQGVSLDEPYTQQGNKALNEKRDHPTQKPTLIYRKLYHDYTEPGQIVWDGHVGSGTNRRAAHDMGLHFTGCENNRDIFDRQEIRWREYFIQSNRLF